MVNETVEDTENFLEVIGPTDIIEDSWGSVPPTRPLFDDYRRQEVGSLFALPQRIVSGDLGGLPSNPIDVFALYMNTLRVQRNMASFQGIKGTLKVKITLRSAITAYGVGMVSWLYGPYRPGDDLAETYTILSSAHAQVFDIPSCPEIVIRIPFISNLEYLDKDALDYVTLDLGYFSFDTLDPTIPATAFYEIWVSMEDVEVTQYIEAQSLPVVVRQQEFNMPGRVSLPVAVAAASTIANVGTSVASSILTQGYTDLRKALYGEIKSAATGGKKKLQTQSETAQKTNENIQTPVFLSPYGNMNSLEPTTALQSMSEMPMWKLNPATYGDVENHSLADLVQNATFYETVVFTNNGDANVFNFSYESLLGYAGYVSQHFRFARARPRIGLWFAFSPLMSARFLIKLARVGDVVIAPSDSSIATTTLLVKGSSYHILEFPYNFDSPVLPTNETSFSFTLALENKGEPTTAGYVPRINVVMFTSMGPNAQFFSIKHPFLQAPVVIEAQSSTREINRGEPTICFTEGPLQTISYMDSVDTVEELCSRWSTQLTLGRVVDNSPTAYNPVPLPPTYHFRNAKYGDNVQHFIPLFALWRGSRDFRYTPDAVINAKDKPTMSSVGQSSYSSFSLANGGFITTRSDPVQMRVPFLSQFRALKGTEDVPDNTSPLPPTDVNLGPDDVVNSRASPDFQLFHLNALYRGYNATTYYVAP